MFKPREIPQVEQTTAPTFSRLSLKRNFSWTFAGNVVYSGAQWLIVVIIAKLGTPEMLGRFALGLAIATPTFVFTNLALRSVLATDAEGQFKIRDYFSLRSLSSMFALLIVVITVMSSRFGTEKALVVIAIGIAKFIESLGDIRYGVFQKLETMDFIAKSMILKGIFGLLALSLGLYLSGSLLVAVTCLAFSWLTVFMLFDVANVNKLSPGESTTRIELLRHSRSSLLLEIKENLPSLKALVILSFPLGIAMLLGSISTNVPRYYLEFYEGERALGIYAAVAALMLAGNTLVSALGQTATSRLSVYYFNGQAGRFARLLLSLIVLGTALGVTGLILSVLAGRDILAVIYQPEYADNAQLLVLLMIAATLQYAGSFLGLSVTAARRFRVQPYIFAASSLASVIMCALLVPIYGTSGAAWAVIIASIVQVLGFAVAGFAAFRELQQTAERVNCG